MRSPAQHFVAESSFHFGVFDLHAASGELRKHGMRVRLSRQAARVLALLLEQPGRVRSREELKHVLWPSQAFGDPDHGLNKAVYDLRSALGDPARNPRYIETVAGRGYRVIDIPGADEPVRMHSRRSWRRMPIAVLPFSVATDEPELATFEREATWRVIEALSRVPGLKVIAYAEVRSWNRDYSMRDLHSEFDVGAVVEGEIKILRGQVYVHLEMLDSCTGLQLWGMHRCFPMGDVADFAEGLANETVSQVTMLLEGGLRHE